MRQRRCRAVRSRWAGPCAGSAFRPAAGDARIAAAPASPRRCRAGRSDRAAGRRSTAAAPPAMHHLPSARCCRGPRRCCCRRKAACAPAQAAATGQQGLPAAVPPGTPSASRDAGRSGRSAPGRPSRAPPSPPRMPRTPSAAGARGSCGRPSRTARPKSRPRPGPASGARPPACPCASQSRPAAGPARSRPGRTRVAARGRGDRPSTRPGSCRSHWWPGCRQRPARTGAVHRVLRPRWASRPRRPVLRRRAARPVRPCRWSWRGSARTGSSCQPAGGCRRERGSGSYGSGAGRACQRAAKIAACHLNCS